MFLFFLHYYLKAKICFYCDEVTYISQYKLALGTKSWPFYFSEPAKHISTNFSQYLLASMKRKLFNHNEFLISIVFLLASQACLPQNVARQYISFIGNILPVRSWMQLLKDSAVRSLYLNHRRTKVIYGLFNRDRP